MIDFRYIASFFFLVLFGGILFSFSTLNFSNFPPQVNATFTGLPAWHSETKHLNPETLYSMLTFAGIIQLVSAAFMLMWSLKYETLYNFILNGEKTSTASFNKLLAAYGIVTGIVTFALLVFDAGKIWSATGVMHNYLEIFILLLLHQGGNLASNNKILPYSFLYLLVAEGITILIEPPYDPFWFKFQGLTIDFILIIQFTRLYLTTKRNYHEGYISLPHHTSNDERESEEHDHRPNHLHRKDCHLSPVFLLPFAFFWHIAGNILTTVFPNEALASYLFVFSYGFLFTSFVFFVYLDTHLRPNQPKKLIFVPDPSTPSIVLVIIASLTLSILCIRIGVFYVVHS
ncbi:patatin-domain-containing protein [Gigaspora margarita]|uniref:Patatin-domain-containing protein n=1 Tax=Gigaspora margarita TaxID=4874 RepID=A0A8H4A2P1_GIGMA|nr:patatin-domain-containing protein [Gigaspora margarita]